MTTMRDLVQKHVPNAIMSAPKRNKYGARKTVLDGMIFDSQAEARRYSELKLLEKAGEIKDLRRQVAFSCVVNGKEVCKYLADFTYTQDGRSVAEDVKGVETALFRLKSKLVDACLGVKIKISKARRA